MANLQQRSGRVNIRVGGNTQETATLVDSLSDGKMLEKDNDNTANVTVSSPLCLHRTCHRTHAPSTDKNTASLVHTRPHVFDEKHLQLCQRPLVSWYKLNSLESDPPIYFWHAGIPFNESGNYRLGIASKGQEILGDYLIGLQAGNEPDLYARHNHRPPVCVQSLINV